ncbi:MAG: hypothetical protein M1136_11100 [Chloroflexi bacterium]|nr:hypothetical protein [Chloroflexota bacterium]MCL5076173.1 hypothetical protein [Chloroflexota bacterium]
MKKVGIVSTSDTSLRGKLKECQYVRIKGKVAGSKTYTNVAGGKVTTPHVEANSVELITRTEAVAPALKVVEVNKALSQHGLTITLQKIEIAANETRAFIKAANGSQNKASLHTYNIVLVQGSKQIKTKSLFGTDYPQPDSSLLPGTESAGIIIFEPVDIQQGKIKLVWDGSTARTDNYNLRFSDWVWEISWE